MGNNKNILQGKKGEEFIRVFAEGLPRLPGVYRMIDGSGKTLYVGKAARLRDRVRSYTRVERLPQRLRLMVSKTRHMTVVQTESEVHAFLLESHLIKSLHPRYNVVLRDDKSYPEIYLDTAHAFPRLVKHRGAHQKQGLYFGPFADASVVREALRILSRSFQLRQCTDYVLAHRKRPCLQYQMRRCSAPCVGYIDRENYKREVQRVARFLRGKQQVVLEDMRRSMEEFARAEKYERAAELRDRITALTKIYTREGSRVLYGEDCDVFVFMESEVSPYLYVMTLRGGLYLGSVDYRFSPGENHAPHVGSILLQFYDARPIPQQIFSNALPHDEVDAMESALSLRAKKRVHITIPKRGMQKRMLDWAVEMAKKAYVSSRRREKEEERLGKRLEELLKRPIQRIECYDNSHFRGGEAVGAGVVYVLGEGFKKDAYRVYSIRDSRITQSDVDMMEHVIGRRVGKNMHPKPDLLLIDGGKAQVSRVLQTLVRRGVHDVAVMGIAKGEKRNAGGETLYIPTARGYERYCLAVNDPLLFFLERVRDEAHRFVIGAHRKKRAKNLSSSLDEIPGIGTARRKKLLAYFGSVRGVRGASVEALSAVPGISKTQAGTIHAWYHAHEE